MRGTAAFLINNEKQHRLGEHRRSCPCSQSLLHHEEQPRIPQEHLSVRLPRIGSG